MATINLTPTGFTTYFGTAAFSASPYGTYYQELADSDDSSYCQSQQYVSEVSVMYGAASDLPATAKYVTGVQCFQRDAMEDYAGGGGQTGVRYSGYMSSTLSFVRLTSTAINSTKSEATTAVVAPTETMPGQVNAWKWACGLSGYSADGNVGRVYRYYLVATYVTGGKGGGFLVVEYLGPVFGAALQLREWLTMFRMIGDKRYNLPNLPFNPSRFSREEAVALWHGYKAYTHPRYFFPWPTLR